MSKNSIASYRPDIDGLRAVAVLSVILFHLNSEVFPGGFVGVDVFFVISGYLITGLVRKKNVNKGFSYRTFFVRRVRRLTPALFFMTSATCIAAYITLLPADLSDFGQSVVSQPIALQNMRFMMASEYFRGSEGRLLLHTWSLGVEEQFYFIWPFTIVLLSKLRRRPTLILLTLILALSFALNLLLPIFSPKTSFFLFPPRAWELGMGGLLAVWEEHREKAIVPRWKVEVGSWFGFILLAGSFIEISGDILFPGWVALFPVFATTLLLASGAQGPSSLKSILSNRILVYLGLISYSLYLWHWPIIVVARRAGFEISNWPVALCLVSLSALCAWLSYRIVERPIRERRVLVSDRSLLATMLLWAAFLVTFGATAIATDGFAFRYHGLANALLTAPFNAGGDGRCGMVFRATLPGEQVCQLNSINNESTSAGVLLWGNSHAAMWSTALASMGTEHGTRVYLNARNCRATVDSDFCGQSTQRSILDYIVQHDIGSVVLAGTWYGSYDIPDNDFEDSLEAIIRELIEQRVDIWLLVDTPQDTSFDPELIYLSAPDAPHLPSIPLSSHLTDRASAEIHLFRRLASDHDSVHIIDPTTSFCDDKDLCHSGHGNDIWYRDGDHLTRSGANLAIDRFLPVFVQD